MNIPWQRLLLTPIISLLALAGTLVLLAAWGHGPPEARAQGTVRYVRIYSSADSGDCSTPATACKTIQYAVDQANDGDEIRIAGRPDAYAGQDNPGGIKLRTYWETQLRPAPAGYAGPAQIQQVVYISRSVTLRGGYSEDFAAWDPSTYRTVLLAGPSGGAARVVFVAPGASPTLEWLYILEGDATDEKGYDAGLSGNKGAGSGVFAEGTPGGSDTITIRNCVIEGNDGSDVFYGGGVYLRYRDSAVLENNIIRGNTATVGGGGIAVSDSADIAIRDNTIAGNQGNTVGGGGIRLKSSPDAVVIGNQIYNNTAVTNAGGVKVESSGGVQVIGNTIYNNQVTRVAFFGGTTTGYGSGIAVLGSDNVVVSGNQVYSNTADLAGGGIHARYAGNLQIIGNKVYNNVASPDREGYGGGIDLSFSVYDVTLRDNVVHGNTASQSASADDGGYGGGVYLGGVNGGVVSGNVITGNVASQNNPKGSGGGLRVVGYNILVSENLIQDNATAFSPSGDPVWSGGGVLVAGSRAITLTNNVIAQNQAPDGGDGVGIVSTGLPAEVALLHNTLADNAEQGIMAVGSGGYITLTGVNTIVSGHTLGISVTHPASSTVTLDYTLGNNTTDYSAGVTHTNDRAGDPAFVDAAGGNYHICAASPAIDQGGNAGVSTDVDGQPRPMGAGYDIGADEYVPADFEPDGDVDIVDIAQVARRFGSSTGDDLYDQTYDLDGDGDIDVVDVQLAAGEWRRLC